MEKRSTASAGGPRGPGLAGPLSPENGWSAAELLPSAAGHRRMVEHHHLVDECRPVLADHVDVDLLGELRALGSGLDAHQARAGVDLRSRAHRAHEAEL